MSEGSRKIFVGGLAWQTTEDNLKFHFERYGPIESVTIMTDRATGNPRGFGFVSFVDAATVDLVCQEKHLLNDKYIDVKKAQDRSTAPPSIHGQEGRPDAAAQSRYDDPSQGQENKLFVGGLGQAITEQALGEYFGKFGELASVAIMKDSATQRSRGFGFVRFKTEEAMTALKGARGPHVCMGMHMEVKEAQSEGSMLQKQGQMVQQQRSDVCPAGENHAYWMLARKYGRMGWRAGYGTHAFGPDGFAVPGWEGSDAFQFKGMFGFSFKEQSEATNKRTMEQAGSSPDAHSNKRARR